MQRMIVYGSCQAEELGRILAASPAVRDRYDVAVHWIGHQFERTEAWAHEIAEADLVFLQDVPELPSYPLWHWNQSRARFIGYPFLTLPALWPFDTARGVADEAAVAAQRAGHGLQFDFQDRLLALMRRHIPDHDERYTAYATLSDGGHPEIAAFLGSSSLQARWNRAAAALLRKDTAHELSVGAAILAQCRVTPMFHTVTHPSAPTLRRLAGELMGKAGISLEPQAALEDGFAHAQVPIHPLVARAHALAWAPDDRPWAVHGTPMTFETYYRSYIATFG